MPWPMKMKNGTERKIKKTSIYWGRENKYSGEDNWIEKTLDQLIHRTPISTGRLPRSDVLPGGEDTTFNPVVKFCVNASAESC